MKIYNQDKTEILDDVDFSLGRLAEDVIVIHHDEVVAIEEKFHYDVINEYPNGGKIVKKVIDIPGVIGMPAYDETENIYVYIPFTEEELIEIHKNELREKRKLLLDAFDKWEKAVLRNRETDDPAIMQWFQTLLDLDEEAFENVPERVEYYL